MGGDLLREDGNEGLIVREDSVDLLIVNGEPQIYILVFVFAAECTDDLALDSRQVLLLLSWNVSLNLLIIARVELVLLELVCGRACPGLIVQHSVGISLCPATVLPLIRGSKVDGLRVQVVVMDVVTLGLGNERGLLLTLLLVKVGVVLLACVLEELLACYILRALPGLVA